MLQLDLPRNTTILKLGGTETLRSSSAALFDTYGTNLQNVEKGIRKIYWADKGKRFLQRDQAGAEALIVAYLTKHGKFRDLFLHNVKPHVYVAMNVFLDTWKIVCKDLDVNSFTNTPIPELKNKDGWQLLDKAIRESDGWKPTERYYFFAKQMCHSLNYGAQADAFRLNVLLKSRGRVVISRKQAEDYVIKYHSLFPEIHDWHRSVQNQINKTGIIFSLQGFPFPVFGKPTDQEWKEWYAVVPQATVGLITHIACTNLQKHIIKNKLDWDVMMNGHDSYLVQCPDNDDEARECDRMMKLYMEQELTSPRGEKFNMRSESQMGYNWGPYKADTNPEGLREFTL